MFQPDFPEFKRLMQCIDGTFGPKLNDTLLQTFWEALKDLPLSSVEAGVQHHLRYGKFFPKPVELRPRESREAMAPSGDSDALKAAQEKTNVKLDWERVKDPIGFALRFNVAYCAKRLAQIDSEGHPGYAEALAQYHYWLKLEAEGTHDAIRAALPTFAVEERMTMAERVKRMEYIREKRAQGIKANQLVFPQESPKNALPNERW